MNKTRKMTEEEAGKILIKKAQQEREVFKINFKVTVIVQIIITCICIAIVYQLKHMNTDMENAVNLIMAFNNISIIYTVKKAYDLHIKYKKHKKVIEAIENNEVADLVKRLEEKGYNTEVTVDEEDSDDVE